MTEEEPFPVRYVMHCLEVEVDGRSEEYSTICGKDTKHFVVERNRCNDKLSGFNSWPLGFNAREFCMHQDKRPLVILAPSWAEDCQECKNHPDLPLYVLASV